MIDEDADLRERFARLRAEERLAIPRFRIEPRPQKRAAVWRAIAAPAALLLVIAAIVTIRSHPTAFSDSDHAIVRSVTEWHPPTDFLLQTPGNEMLTTTPQIPDWKGIPR